MLDEDETKTLIEYAKALANKELIFEDSIYFPNGIIELAGVTKEQISPYFRQEMYGITFFKDKPSRYL